MVCGEVPSSEDIVKGLNDIANEWPILAVVWHVYFATIVLALMAGYRAARRLLAIQLAAPLLSVCALAWVHANPFNGIVFALASIALIAVGARLGKGKVALASKPFVVTGAIMFAFGWTYPHFLNQGSMLSYLYAAPTGLIPCPTLSTIAGMTLILGGFSTVLWPAIVGILGLFYGYYGAAILGVSIDWVLFAGAICLFMVCVVNHRKIRAAH